MGNHLLALPQPDLRPESTDYTRQPTARSAGRIARHAAIAAAEASVNLAAAVGTSADLTSVVHGPTDLTSAVHAPADLTPAVHAPIDLTSAVQAPAGQRPLLCLLPSVAHWGYCLPDRVETHLPPVFLTRRALSRPCAPPRLYTLLCRPPSYAERKFLEPEPLARQRAGVWLNAP